MLTKSPFIISQSGFKLLLLSALLVFSSCAGKNQDAPTEIRIVDLNGNPKPVKRFVPEGNAQILANNPNIEVNKNNIAPANGKLTQNDIPEMSTQTPNNNSADLAAPAQSTTLASQNNNQPEATVSYDLSNDKPVSTSNNKLTETKLANNANQNSSPKKFKLAIASAKAPKGATVSNKSGTFIQIGSFSVAENANKILSKSAKISKGSIEEIDSGDKKSYRVLLGPIANSKKANIILKQAKNAGYKDAFIVK
ncbi:MAG: SPOR domain-containing protein [Pseudomonadota bacterium]